MSWLFQYRAFLKEFPFVPKFVEIVFGSQAELTGFNVERTDSISLSFVPGRSNREASIGWGHCDARIFVLDKRGSLLVEVERFQIKYRSFRSPVVVSAGETVSKAVERLPDPSAAFFVLSLWRREYFPDIKYGESSTESRFAVIAKPPKGHTIISWIQEEERRADERLKSSLATIDKIDGN